MNQNKSKRQLTVLVAVGVLLLIPLVAMQFTSEVNWSLSDFVIMGLLLSATGLVVEWVLRSVSSARVRLLLFMLVLGLFLAVWAQLAVGIVDWLPGGS